jgi:hypothetical protein
MLHVLSTREWHHSGSPGRAGGAPLVAAADAFDGNASWEELLEGWEGALQGEGGRLQAEGGGSGGTETPARWAAPQSPPPPKAPTHSRP